MYLITTDLHLTDRSDDEYRWKLFPWLKKIIKNKNVKHLYILGDLTDLKDYHSSILVNKIVDVVTSLSKYVDIVILMGNHDYRDANHPYFKFLNKMEHIQFIFEPLFIGNHFFIPNIKENVWNDIIVDIEDAKYIFMHQTMNGAVSSNGYTLKGIDAKMFKGLKAKIYSGDVHPPQKIGPVTYVGTPYSVKFGDHFNPRLILLSGNKEISIPTKFLRRWSIKITEPEQLFDDERLVAGDQIKVSIKIPRQEIVEWPNYRQRVFEVCSELELEVFDVQLIPPKRTKRISLSKKQKTDNITINKDSILKNFCRKEKLSSEIKAAGLDILTKEKANV